MIRLVKEGITYLSSPFTNAEIISGHVDTAQEVLKRVKKVTNSVMRHRVDYYKVLGDVRQSLEDAVRYINWAIEVIDSSVREEDR